MKKAVDGWDTESLQELGAFIEGILMAREEEAENN
jgi:hypothetical protein